MTSFDVLLACLRRPPDGEATPLPASINWDELVELAIAHGVAPLLYHRLQSQPCGMTVPASVLQTVKQLYIENALRNAQIQQQLVTVLSALYAQGIRIILLKGVYLAAVAYEQMAARTMSDIDLMVAPADMPKVITLLTELGYQPVTPLIELDAYLAHYNHLPCFVKPGAAKVEVHGTLTWPRQRYTIAMTDIWARAYPLHVGGLEITGLDPADLLLYICLHATYQHLLEQGVRPLCDIDAICQRFAATLDWAQVVARAQQWHWMRGVYLTLQLAHDLLATPIPPAVLAALQPDEAQTLLSEAKLRLRAGDAAYSQHISLHFGRMWQEAHGYPKVQKVLQRIFLPRNLLAADYHVPPDSLKLYLYYLVHFSSMLVRYGRVLYQLRRKNAALSGIVRRKAQLVTWLDETT